jgi:hypothetical protein
MVPTQEKQIFFLNLHWTELIFFNSAVITGVQMGEMSKTGLTDRMIYQIYMGGSLIFLVCGVWFNLEDLRFIPTYFLVSFVRMLG